MRPGFDPWVGKMPWRREWQATPVFLTGKPHGRRSLVGYGPWGHKESDTTERLNNNRKQQRWESGSGLKLLRLSMPRGPGQLLQSTLSLNLQHRCTQILFICPFGASLHLLPPAKDPRKLFGGFLCSAPNVINTSPYLVVPICNMASFSCRDSAYTPLRRSHYLLPCTEDEGRLTEGEQIT